VIARRSVWSDPEVVDLLQNFVPVADEVHRLQKGSDPEALLFQKVAEQGHYAGHGPPEHTGTRQGTYAAAPSGVLLASINSNDPRAMAGMLRRALNKWRQMPPSERRLTADPRGDAEAAARVRAERLYPEGGLVLRVYSRDLPRTGSHDEQDDLGAAGAGDWRARAWNLDFAWFTRQEAAQFVPAEPIAGQRHNVPAPLIRRLARLHFVDNVRGQTIGYRDGEVKTAELSCGVTSRDDHGRITLRLDGKVALVAEGAWSVNDRHDANDPQAQTRGFNGRLLGTALWDLAAERFAAFDLVAAGTRWGATQYNVRRDDQAPAPLGFALTLAGDTPAERVAPAAFWSYGWR
jgi:hypothetical protein